MLEILKFIFSSFWIWLGTVILLGVAVDGFRKIINITIKRDKKD